jgi:hypothetical protein
MSGFFVTSTMWLVLGGIAWMLARSKPLSDGVDGGVIRPERWTALLTVLGGLGLFFLPAYRWATTVQTDGQKAAEGFCMLLGLAVAAFMAPSLTSIHAVAWNDEGVSGPSSRFGPTLGLSKAHIRWDEIARVGRTLTGYWFVEATDGRRVYWSYLYKGYGAFDKALHAHCPSLAPLPNGATEL